MTGAEPLRPRVRRPVRPEVPVQPKKQELLLRVASAIVLIPLAVAATWFGGLFYAGLIVLGTAIVFLEWASITIRGASKIGVGIVAAVTVGAVAASAVLGPVPGLALIAVATGILFMLVRLVRASFGLATGLLYAGLGGIALVSLRAGPLGLAAVLFLFAVVWASDIAAYFTGRTLGGPKLWPKVSPNKTWSGAIGGLVIGVAAGIGVVIAVGLPVGIGVAATAALLSIAGQLGDLFESAIKRRVGRKDSGSLIPGHGGLMDRVDALIAAAILGALIGWLRGGLFHPAAGLLLW
ncbi:phosphatidate cytidylyltransferase [Rhodobium gokarnense]|uniref:Phosphatidate cytidylyltransferase n=1 Tax=Rhodobium gokarnense TaxID=364296 RepID=A0ABT3HB51_9HYPH|nr:phosphatidate cytidylyltransferase [Rhodobium gokarnense]MCW2307610.1 phosphatidate cytidylyltransferase [Rhodobium gokarnense]